MKNNLQAMALTTLLLFASNSQAATITVSTTADTIGNDGSCSLREAIINANNNNQSGSTDCSAGSGFQDLIQLPAGTYTLALADTTSYDEEYSQTGDLDIRSNLTLSGDKYASTIIDANNIHRVIETIDSVNSVRIRNLTLKNGDVPSQRSEYSLNGGAIYNIASLNLNSVWVTDSSALDMGGGIYTEGSLTLSAVRIADNESSSGGGMAASSASLSVNNTEFENNAADLGSDFGLGGGVYLQDSTATFGLSNISSNTTDSGVYTEGAGIYAYNSEVTFSNCSIHNNSNGVGSFAGGGGIAVDAGIMTIVNSVIRNNLAGASTLADGGGIKIHDGELIMEGSTVVSNWADDFGGGIHFSSSFIGASSITSSNISQNTGAHGGGLYLNFDDSTNILPIRNSTIADNQSVDGGGIYASENFGLALENSTISGNTARNYGGGIYNDSDLDFYNVTLSNNSAGEAHGLLNIGSGTVNVKNSILASNYGEDCYGTINSLSYSIVQNASSCTILSGTPISGPANLDSLTDNGGSTNTHALLFGSTAINAGDPSGCVDIDGSILTMDQRGYSRDSQCDIGAYELGGE